ncbi:MAG: hypothetical protein K6T91_04160 [Firmicutes bacterium]|nr:hypothetical protein [Bacillota bacterium]
MKKFLLIALGIALILTLLTGVTFSYMTAEAENPSNTISTGSLQIITEPQPFMKISGLTPGGVAQEAAVNIFASTPTKFFYKIRAVRQTGTSTKLWNALMVEIKDDVTGETWTGKLNGLETTWFARQNGVESGEDGLGHLIRFKVWIPQEADVDAQTTATAEFRFDAEQWRPATS